MRAIVLTSTRPRHHFLVHTVSRRVDVVGVWRETKQVGPLPAAQPEADRKVLAAHFAARDTSECAALSCHATARSLAARASCAVMSMGASNEHVRADRPRVPHAVRVFIARLFITMAEGLTAMACGLIRCQGQQRSKWE